MSRRLGQVQSRSRMAPAHPSVKPNTAPGARVLGGLFIFSIGLVFYWFEILSPGSCVSQVPTNPGFCTLTNTYVMLGALGIGFLITLTGAIQLALQRSRRSSQIQS